MFYSTVQDKYGGEQLIEYFRIASGKDFEYFQHDELIYVWDDKYANYPDLIITYYVHVLKYLCIP